jgi:hypothetical protein
VQSKPVHVTLTPSEERGKGLAVTGRDSRDEIGVWRL